MSLAARVSRVVQLGIAVCLTVGFPRMFQPEVKAGEDVKVLLASPVTHSDWMLRDPAPAWGKKGVRQILDRCKECGIARVYWRCFDGGRACYPSRLMRPLHGFDEDNYHKGKSSAWVVDKLKKYDFGEFDALKEAIEYGHTIGLEVHAWLTINEDDHGWGLVSQFAKDNQELVWTRNDGKGFRSQMSFAFSKVREYKLGLVKEILEYKPDGLFLDWIRTGDVREGPHTDADGVALYGYEKPNIDAFQKKYGTDPRSLANNDERWARLRAEPQTNFMRDANALLRQVNKKTVISAMVQHPFSYRGDKTETHFKDNLNGLLCDVGTWATEGLIDQIVFAGYYREGGTPEKAFESLRKETGGKVPVWLFGWIGSPDQFVNDVRLAAKLQAPQLLLWESDYLGLPPANAGTVKIMRDYNHSGIPH